MAVIKLINVRLGFPNLWEPDQKFNKFSACFPIDPKSANAKALDYAVQKVAKEKWGAKADAILSEIKRAGRLSYIESPKRDANGEVYGGFEGAYTCNTSSDTKPQVIDKDTSPLTKADGKPYGGCYVDASVEVWAQDNSWGKRINAKLRWVQFRSDGDSFSGGVPVSQDEFSSIADGAAADDLM